MDRDGISDRPKVPSFIDCEDDDLVRVPVADQQMATARVEPERSWRSSEAGLVIQRCCTARLIHGERGNGVEPTDADEEGTAVGVKLELRWRAVPVEFPRDN